ncbi:MAG: UbiD family decarboxylase [Candidatus Tectomicrobia bacterium]|nr:UbiD family decarboxylase [Candidatus Tectomicrobia bacterium]
MAAFPLAFADLRAWIDYLERHGQLARVEAPVHWHSELGLVLRRAWDVYGDAAPALLFTNIIDYPPPGPHRLFTGALRGHHRLAMLMGLDPAAAGPAQLVEHLLELLHDRRRHLPPKQVHDGPVLENVLTGDAIDLFRFPIPHWNERDGGRYLGTLHCVITRDPDSGACNYGTYRMQAFTANEAAINISPSQHIGGHFAKHLRRRRPMEAAVVIGQEPALTLLATCPTHDPVAEIEVAGALRGAPIEVVRCRTVDLEVPAHAEIVVEGYVDWQERRMEGPFGEFAGYHGMPPSPKPVFKVNAVLHRDDPIFRGTLEGHPVNEDHVMSSVLFSAYFTELLRRLGVPGVRRVAMPLDAAGYGHCVVSIRPSAAGQADMIAHALWASRLSPFTVKHVIVVDEDIDPWNSEQVNWSIAWRVRATEDIKIWPRHRSLRTDPRIPPEEKDFCDRMLIDATRPVTWKPRSLWGYEGVEKGRPLRFPPSTKPSTVLARQVNDGWQRYGITPAPCYNGKPAGMMQSWWESDLIQQHIDGRMDP